MATERKLAAILAADIAGYSRLMEADEEATLKALRAHRELVDKLVADRRGRIFSSAGDSVVAEFPSAVEATLCAVAIQREIALRNEAVPKDKRLLFRVGINIGDVVVEDGNLFGDGVNVAARIQALADPGGVCVARNVHDQLRNKTAFTLEAMGEHLVKNIAVPVSVYRVLMDGKGGRSWLARSMARARPYRRFAAVSAVAAVLVVGGGLAGWFWQRTDEPASFPSLAVMPFSNFSADPALDRYGDAVAEAITTVLSRFPDLTVVSRNSAFAYKNRNADAKQIGQELGVRYVLEGSVQRKGENLQITAQLIDATSNLHVWADEYGGTESSSLQDEATRKLAAALAGDRGQIRLNEYKRTQGKERAEFNEYDYFLSGHELFNRGSSIEEHDRAGDIWREGLDKYPHSKLLQVSLARYYFRRPEDYDTLRPAADFQRAEDLAREALAGSNVPPIVQWWGRSLMAYLEWQHGDFERAISNAEAAVSLAPYDANTLSFLARVQLAAGNVGRGLEWVQESALRMPQVGRNTRLLAWGYYLTGEFDKSIAAAQEHMKLSRGWSGDALGYMAASYTHLDRMDDARVTIDRLKEVEPSFTLMSLRQWQFERPYKDKAIAERERADLARAGLAMYPFGYDSRIADRLTADEIRTLIFGHTVKGRDINTGEKFTDIIAADGSTEETADWGPDTATFLYLDDQILCHTWKEWGPNCSAIFRNPGGTRAGQDEFAWIFGAVELHFSVDE